MPAQTGCHTAIGYTTTRPSPLPGEITHIVLPQQSVQSGNKSAPCRYSKSWSPHHFGTTVATDVGSQPSLDSACALLMTKLKTKKKPRCNSPPLAPSRHNPTKDYFLAKRHLTSESAVHVQRHQNTPSENNPPAPSTAFPAPSRASPSTATTAANNRLTMSLRTANCSCCTSLYLPSVS